ncbi:2-dehydropantoate 2-reductase [Halopseudomonas bauzanensis]|uniref:2-dehydropantoate 2-reductase n=1 Tax=Halopseudomonas bauzanensis TaxID=653930 RepID=UPI001F32C9B2|nr:2-dehydropantoate 2-reductase [Halopseudomonas bauzanensis]
MSEPLHILGAGSLGLLWAARCARAGIDCRLILRTPAALREWLDRDSVLLLERQETIESLPVTVELADSSNEPIRHLIIATKAWAVAGALESIASRLQADSQLVLLQNGLGSQQATSQRFPTRRVLYASTTDGAWKRAANHVVWAGIGQTLLGDPRQEPAPEWLALLTQAGIDWRWEQDILPVLWLKLAINCAINPITALHDCPNGEVPKRAGALFAPLLAELHTLLASQGVQLSLTELTQRVHSVIQATAANSSSMRQDVHAGRRTEIDFILGHACRTARLAGLATPVLDSLHQQLQDHLINLGLPPA